jgi:hypothetical protein
MQEQSVEVSTAQVLQILTTEHAALQAVRSSTILEANGRTSLFIGTVSSAVVALAFLGRITEMSREFVFFALILLPSLIFIGVVTFLRCYQVSLEDLISIRGINRIRHYYTELAPSMEAYFIHSNHDDHRGVIHNMGARNMRLQQFLSTAGLVGVITGILTGVFVGLLISVLFGAPLEVCVAVGFLAVIACVYACSQYMKFRWEDMFARLDVKFPTGDET